MPNISENIKAVRAVIPAQVSLVCVSKYQSEEAIWQAYHAGERDFGESRVQEMIQKYRHLPQDIRWHFIGHLQTNKVRQAVACSTLIQSVDSLHLLEAIDTEAARQSKVQDVLLEVHVAKEVTKTGFLPTELPLSRAFAHVRICGIMGMASHTDEEREIRRCFRALKALQGTFPILSMGMSEDYPLAIEEGSTMVRIGSAIFGEK